MPITYNIETDYLYQQGMEKGMEKERLHYKEEKRESARKMLLAGIKTAQVADFLGLTEKEVTQIAEELRIS